ncbi:MAG: circularly permuted type 2 ATP-grasp protein, partial [Proteobacteria bacterium]|nr:circularly permuted type 2 ATP-grasp protein [Pseudomonadota bacterium]
MISEGGVDEMVDGQGGIRPQWRGLLGVLGALGEGGLAERARRLDRAFDDEGVTSILPGANDQSWRCDPVPLLIGAAEFAELEAGLAQRARLMQAILADIYGPQSLLSDGVLPPALVFANPGYLRPCGIAPGAGQGARPSLLDFYAADLIRGPDGAWRVLADRTAGAAGIAQARENRRMLARVLP